MPEGPEVRLSADAIRPLVVGKQIVDAYSTPNSRYGDSRGIMWLGNSLGDYDLFVEQIRAGKAIVDSINVHGKFMWWNFSTDLHMFCTFGMTGQWSAILGKHPCFVFEFDDGSKIHFNDPRHFGTIKFSNGLDELEGKLSSLGWDPLSRPFKDARQFIIDQLRSSKYSSKCIAELLMNQKIFSGVGNYIKSESLYRAQISPLRFGGNLSDQEVDLLGQSIMDVMQQSYQNKGATIQTYQTVNGERGEFSNLFKVYRKTIDPLGNVIKKQTTPDKRSTYWCPTVQK